MDLWQCIFNDGHWCDFSLHYIFLKILEHLNSSILVLKFVQDHFLPIDLSKKTAESVANSVGLDQILPSVMSDLGLHCLPIYPNT